jgi:hypothetical protein
MGVPLVILTVVILNDAMLNVSILTVVVLNVMAMQGGRQPFSDGKPIFLCFSVLAFIKYNNNCREGNSVKANRTLIKVSETIFVNKSISVNS